MITENQMLDILFEEVVPAEGCTEPIALAYIGAKVREILGAIPNKVQIHVSGNIIKNVKSVIIPNSGGMIGIESAVALGIIAGDSSKELMVISDLNDDDIEKTKQFMKEAEIRIIHEPTDIKLYILIKAQSDTDDASVEVKHIHTNITKIERNGEILLKQPCNDSDFNSPVKDREKLTLKAIYDVAQNVELSKIEPLFDKVIKMNSAIADEGLKGTYGINIGQIIRENIKSGIYGDDARNNAASYAAAGADARMSGCPLPVMTASGSGNQGITASLALIEYARYTNSSKENLIRALFFSHMATVHIKTNVGRLSAYCGVVCAAAAFSGALCLIQDKSFEVVSHAITNTLGDISGIICDGAKASCAKKIATSMYAAFDGAMLACAGRYLHGGDGIIEDDVEKTLMNIRTLSQSGMKITDEVIIDIMSNNSNRR